ncbi:MAG: DUF2480 family protein [Flavobacteriaceae bacterium]
MEIVNRVAESGLITIDPAVFVNGLQMTQLKLSDFLEDGVVLREKTFREKLKKTDWSIYKGKYVGILLADDLLIPQWAPMLLSSKLAGIAKGVCVGDQDEVMLQAFNDAIEQLDLEPYRNKNLIVKGCGDGSVPPSIYVRLIARLTGVANRIAYGEACSSVPLFKR